MPKNKTELSKIEIWDIRSNIASRIFIPIILMVGGWVINDSLQKSQAAKTNVQLAVDLLKSKDTPQYLKKWALKMLNDQSPVSFDDGVYKKLRQSSTKIAFKKIKRNEFVNDINRYIPKTGVTIYTVPNTAFSIKKGNKFSKKMSKLLSDRAGRETIIYLAPDAFYNDSSGRGSGLMMKGKSSAKTK